MRVLFTLLLALSSGLWAQETIPSGTILPLKLTSSLDSRKIKPGTIVTARVMQDVPLRGGVKIPAGAKVAGQVLESGVLPAGVSRLVLRFDTLTFRQQSFPITSDLRAMASMLEVDDAQIPTTAPGIGDVWVWMDTNQIGGDAVYGQGGPVMNGSEVVGTAVPGGVLVKVRANHEAGCRAEIDGNDAPQALWVFSADACGVYGFSGLKIAHAGRGEPRGVIVLESGAGPVRVKAGTGVLLRLTAPR